MEARTLLSDECVQVFGFFLRRRTRAAWIHAEAEALIRELGDGGYEAALRMQRTANELSEAWFWRSVKEAVARKTEQGGVETKSSQGAPAAEAPHAVASTPGSEISKAEYDHQALIAAMDRFPRGLNDVTVEVSTSPRSPSSTADWHSSAIGWGRFAERSVFSFVVEANAMLTGSNTTALDASLSQNEQYRLLVDSVTDCAIYMLDPNGVVMSWNPGAQRFKGYESAEIVGKHFSAFYTAEDRARGEPDRTLETASRDGHFESEGWRVRKDGRRFWASVIVDPIRAPDGALLGFAKITRDFTEKREAQIALNRAQAAMFQSQKMEAIGQLAAGVANDFNNLLAAILTSLQFARKRAPEDAAGLIGNAIQAAQRGAALTRRMLAFSGRSELDSESIDLPTFVEGMVDLLQSCMGPSTSIETQLPPGLNAIRSDPHQLEHALLNLALNARDAMPRGGSLKILLREELVTEGRGSQVSPGRYACLSIADSGEGMDEATLSRAIEPFYTTKGAGKGAGLGLSMVHGFVTKSGGQLVLSSVKGNGTTAEIWLPLAGQDGKAREETVHARAPSERTGSFDVLAVDDDDLVLTNLTAMLEDLGHKVVAARSGAQALEILSQGATFDLLVTDQAMPEMAGSSLIDAARDRQPNLMIILAAGDGEAPEEIEPGVATMAKPFREGDLAKAISEASSRNIPFRNVVSFSKRG